MIRPLMAYLKSCPVCTGEDSRGGKLCGYRLKLPDEKAPANPEISSPQAVAGGMDYEEIPDSDFEPLF